MAVFSIAIGALVAASATTLPESPFEPLGSGSVPTVVAWIAIILGLGLLLRLAWSMRRRDGQASVPPEAREAPAGAAAGDPDRPTLGGVWIRMMLLFALTAVYAWVLSTEWVRYAVATFVFLVLTILMLAERPKTSLVPAIVCSAVFAGAIDYTFRYLLVADIP